MSSQMQTLCRTLLPAAALFALAVRCAPAATLTWPNLGSIGACRDTLQACIDGAVAGDIVQIGVDDLLFPDRYTAVNENILLNKSITLRAAAGIDAVFLAGRNITMQPPAVALTAYSVAVEGVILDRGRILINDATLLPSTYRVEGVRFNDVPIDQTAIGTNSVFGTNPTFQIFRNALRVRTTAGTATQGINVFASGPNWTASIVGNRIEAPQGGLRRAITVTSPAAGPINIAGNSIVGRDFAIGIAVSQPASSALATLQVVNNSISGQNAATGLVAAGLQLDLTNADAQVINNTVVDGSKGVLISSSSSGSSVSGLIANNLIAYQRSEGLVIASSVPAVANRNNLVFGNFSDSYTAGAGTLTSDPQLISRIYPRPRDTSPAINAGSNSALPAFNGFDVDGVPRILLATIDMGAYEAGYGLTGVHTSDGLNTLFNETDLYSLNGQPLVPDSILVVTSLHTASPAAALTQNIGVWLPGGTGALPLAIFNQDSSVPMPTGRRYAVTEPGFGLSGFTHATTAGNVSAQYTTLTHPTLDGHPEAIAVATHNFGESGPYHDFAIGLEYIGTHWNLRNEDATVDMLSGRRFNIVIAPALSENALRIVASAAAAEIPLSHPLLDDNGCAAPIVGRVDIPGAPLVTDTVPFSLDYRAGLAGAPGRWFIVAEPAGSAAFPAGAGFNVIVDGAEASGCRATAIDTIFENGFE